MSQDPEDEAANVLLQRLAAERDRLVKDGKVRKPKALPPVAEDEVPFEVPRGWVWARCSQMLASVTDGDHQPPPRADAGIPFLVIGNVSSGSIQFTGTRYVPDAYYKGLDWSRRPGMGDLLYTVTGSFGIVVAVDTNRPFCVQRHIGILKSASCTNAAYLRLALSSPSALAYAAGKATGTAQKTVSLAVLRGLPIPVPPLAEQHRIVARVDELMHLLDRLEQQLLASRKTQEAFAASAVHHLEA